MDVAFEDCYFYRLQKALDIDLARYGGSLKIVNAAVPAVGSSFFIDCGLDSFVNGQVDLYILELAGELSFPRCATAKLSLTWPVQSTTLTHRR